jgi:hypothetical protein
VKTLQDYLLTNGTQHVLVSTTDDQGNTSFYIHPTASGQTLDFTVLGNILLPMQVHDKTGIVVKTAAQIIDALKTIKPPEQVLDNLKAVNEVLERTISQLDRIEVKLNHG